MAITGQRLPVVVIGDGIACRYIAKSMEINLSFH